MPLKWWAVAAGGNPIPVKASDTLKHSNDTLRQTQSITYVKLKEIKLKGDVQGVRLKFTLGTNWSVYPAIGRVYKNGVAIGTERSTALPTAEFSEDFTGWVKDDLIQIYGRVTSPGHADAWCRVSNQRIYYNPDDVGTNQDP